MISTGDGCGQLVGGKYDVVLTSDHDNITSQQPVRMTNNVSHQSTIDVKLTNDNSIFNNNLINDVNVGNHDHGDHEHHNVQQVIRHGSSPSISSSAGSAVPHFGRVLTNYLERFEQLEIELEQAIRAGLLANCGYANEFRLLKEFSKQLRQNKENLREGELDVNQIKNRYKDIIPFSHTRVSLLHDLNIPGSDYINANYIRGASGSPQAYIACQGPLPGTLVDFWRMIWECRVSVLVMACNEFESGKSKCEIYWPQELNTTANFGPFEIRLLRVRQICPDFLVRKFSIQLSPKKQSPKKQHINPLTTLYSKQPSTNGFIPATSASSQSTSSMSTSSASSSLSSTNCCQSCIEPTLNSLKREHSQEFSADATGNGLFLKPKIDIAPTLAYTEMNNDKTNANHCQEISTRNNNLNVNSDTSANCYKMQISPTAQQQQTKLDATASYLHDNNKYDNNNNNNNTNIGNDNTKLPSSTVNPSETDIGGGETRIICQFHYTTWPDHGAPRSMQPILEMVRLMREVQPAEDRPILVHCSAGCGRTGTICCIDYVWGLLRRGELDPSFDLCSIISEMRQQRMAMVQTLEQYILCHRAVAALFIDQLKLIDDHTYENLDDLGPLDAVEAASRAEPSALTQRQQQQQQQLQSIGHEGFNGDNDRDGDLDQDIDEDQDSNSSNVHSDDDLTGPVFI